MYIVIWLKYIYRIYVCESWKREWKNRHDPASNESSFEKVKDETESSGTHWWLWTEIEMCINQARS